MQGTSGQNTLHLSTTLPNGTANQAYNAVLSVSGGSAPYQFSVKSGSMPQGLSLNSSTGSITGTPTTAGTFSFEIAVVDAPQTASGSQNFVITVGGGGVTVHVSPISSTLVSGQKQQFTATVSGTANTAVTWMATAGSIDANGLYTAPNVNAQMTTLVSATSKADPTRKAEATITVEKTGNTQPPTIATTELPPGQQGSSYSATLTASGGTQPYTWSVASGNPPDGLTLTAVGQLAGLPSAPGAYTFSIAVKDANAQSAQRSFTVSINSSGNFDGPAELPRVTVSSSLADTPAPGTKTSVNAGADLQAALNNAHCGDTLELQAGATFSGKFVLPNKPCDDNHWIVIRTSAPDSSLPAEGQRLTPCYAGVASLPGRPQYSCSNPHNVLARLLLNQTGDGVIRFADGANHYRIIGLEITRPTGMTTGAKLMMAMGVADHIVLDHSWLHGTAQDETHAGFDLNGIRYGAVVDSYFSDFKCVSMTGSCTDAHAVSGGVSTTHDGPYLIQNNFLEASGEAVMFGGGAATSTPTDIQVLHNHFFKPMQWMKGQPNFVGGVSGNPFVVKNHFELKNAVRVQFEANLLENSWGGFSQSGFAILLSPKNQHTPSGANVCPICQVTDVTIRYSRISHAGAGIQLATVISGDGTNGAPALAGSRWSLHDLVFDDLNPKYVGGGSAFLIMNSWPTNSLNHLTINHVTAFPYSDSHIMVVGNLLTNQAMTGFVFTNNLVVTGDHPVWNTGGGTASCAYEDVPVTSISKCFATYTFKNNALVANPPQFPPSSWPSGNLFTETVDEAGFVNYNNGNGGNYTLLPSSPYKNKGTDGKDLGADIAGLNAALVGVE